MISKFIRILLIEDNPESIQLIQEELLEENANANKKFKLEFVGRLSAGIERISKGGIDVILLDMSLPDSQGIDTFIEAHNHAPGIPIIVFSNHDDETLAVKTLQEGAQDYLIKARVNRDLLIRSISYSIERHQTLKKKLEQAQLALQRTANHDNLTGLPNRKLLYEFLDKSIARARRYNKIIAIMFLDLDKFKLTNDSLGHVVGDLLLQSVAKRIKSCVRESDIVARMGGDEFIVVLESIDSVQHAATVANRIVKILSNVHILEGNKLNITTSIGISLCPDDSVDLETLIKNADTAMYNAKKSGKNRYKYFHLS